MASIEVDLTNLQHNLRVIKRMAPHSKVLAMIKGNAYGHGMVPVAETLANQVDALGVARWSEASELRAANIDAPIVIVGGCDTSEELMAASNNHCAVVVHSLMQLALIEQTPLATPVSVWIKINTGMNRLGLAAHEVADVVARLTALDYIKKPFVFMTHFSDADDKVKNKTETQLKRFYETVDHYTGELSTAGSAGLTNFPQAQLGWIRPGIMLYGASAVKNTIGEDLGLKPVMTLKAKLVAIHELEPGDQVGYGSTWQAQQYTRLGVANIGYGDGYPRHAECGTPVLVNGVRCEVVGRVSMDSVTIDLTHQPRAQMGDEVILWGKGLPAELVAVKADTIAYELFTRMAPRHIAVTYIY